MAPATVTFTRTRVDPAALVPWHITVDCDPVGRARRRRPHPGRSRLDGRTERQRHADGKTADGMPLDWPANSTITITVDATTAGRRR